MPTAVEYALLTNSHTQNGCGGGPPTAEGVLTQNGLCAAGQDATVMQLPSAIPAGDWVFTGPLAALFLVAAVAAVVRRKAGRAAP